MQRAPSMQFLPFTTKAAKEKPVDLGNNHRQEARKVFLRSVRTWDRIYWIMVLLSAVLSIYSLLRPFTFSLTSPLSAPRNLHYGVPDVQFDGYSLVLRGQRVFVHSGEFHTWRLPVPSLWPDILQKAKAAGLNTISVYTHMGLMNPAPGVVDFDGYRGLVPLYQAAREEGLFLVMRPGYINAETSAGGISHWATSEVAGHLRSNETDWKAAWQDYIKEFIKVTVPYQLDNSGPVIAIQVDNEYTVSAPGAPEYFAELEEVYKNSGIVVPLSYNDPGMHRNFINGTGAVDLYGFDEYPQEFDCSHPYVWRPVKTQYHLYHEEVNPSQPLYIPEFQGGSYDAWGPTAPGYPACAILTGPDFQSVFNLQLWASNAKLISYYMFYGGTSWGAIPFHGVYTSYDYGAPVSESRELTTKYTELKRQGLFLRSSLDFAKTDWVGDSDSPALKGAVTSDAAFVTELRNPDTGAAFYVLRQRDSTSTNLTQFKLHITTTVFGPVQVPVVALSITLSGRQSKLVLADYVFGHSRLDWTTAQVFFAGVIGTRDVILIYGDVDQEHEVTLHLRGAPNKAFLSAFVQTQERGAHTIISVLPGHHGLLTIWDSDAQLVLFVDSKTAGTFWAPSLAGAAQDPLRNFWGLGTNETVLVGGPYLVRSACVTGSKLELRGDLKEDGDLVVIAPEGFQSVTWNGREVAGDFGAAGGVDMVSAFGGVFVGQVQMDKVALTGISVPKELAGWKFKDSLPEVQEGYDDGQWTVAEKRSTNSPWKMHYGDGRVLYGCDYGFCEGVVLWRGHFDATGYEKGVNLSINGGEAFAASVWLNDVFLKTTFGNSTNNENIIEETDETFYFPAAALKPDEDNVITIIQDNMGLNETDGLDADTSKSPRGVRGFQLDSGNFSTWKVQGKVGGYVGYPDKVRGIFNEGGLFGERKGWHLPEFDTSGWESHELVNGLPGSEAGVGFFVTNFELRIPKGYDVPIAFRFAEPEGQPYRALLFVNGWMMGKRVANLGPQSLFPVHEGILNYNGVNTVAVALWAMIPGIPITPDLHLEVLNVYEGGVGGIIPENPGWSREGRN